MSGPIKVEVDSRFVSVTTQIDLTVIENKERNCISFLKKRNFRKEISSEALSSVYAKDEWRHFLGISLVAKPKFQRKQQFQDTVLAIFCDSNPRFPDFSAFSGAYDGGLCTLFRGFLQGMFLLLLFNLINIINYILLITFFNRYLKTYKRRPQVTQVIIR